MIPSSHREQSLQDQLRQAKESVSTMQKLHELAQSQLFELRAQSGDTLILMASSFLFVVTRHSELILYASSFCPAKVMSLYYLICCLIISDEDTAAKQSELSLLMDEVERAQTRLLSLEREKVHLPYPLSHIFKRIQLTLNP